MAEKISEDYKVYINVFLITILSFFSRICNFVKPNKKEKCKYDKYKITQKEILTNETSHIPFWFINKDIVQIKASKGLTIETSFILIVTKPKAIITRGVDSKEGKCEQTQSRDVENDSRTSCNFQRKNRNEHCRCKSLNESSNKAEKLENAQTSNSNNNSGNQQAIFDKQDKYCNRKCLRTRKSFRQTMFCKRCHKPIVNSESNSNADDEFGEIDGNSFVNDDFGHMQITTTALMSQLNQNRALYPNMKNMDDRMKSFINNKMINYHWYFMQFNTQWKYQTFVDAGFFLTKDGKLLCYECGLCIRHEIEDFPLHFHKEWSPTCTAVLNSKNCKIKDNLVNINF